MNKIHRVAFTLLAGLSLSGVANSGVIFYTDKALFDASVTTTLVDFEGITGTFTTSNSQLLGGVTFTTTGINMATICGKYACSGGPHESSLFVADQHYAMIVDLSTAGSGFTAVGGFFGDLDLSPGDYLDDFTVYGASGQTIDVRSVATGDFYNGGAGTFIGWTTTDGDEITGLRFQLGGPTGHQYYEALDNFQFGTVVPLPPAVWLFGSALGVMGWIRRKAAADT